MRFLLLAMLVGCWRSEPAAIEPVATSTKSERPYRYREPAPDDAAVATTADAMYVGDIAKHLEVHLRNASIAANLPTMISMDVTFVDVDAQTWQVLTPQAARASTQQWLGLIASGHRDAVCSFGPSHLFMCAFLTKPVVILKLCHTPNAGVGVSDFWLAAISVQTKRTAKTFQPQTPQC